MLVDAANPDPGLPAAGEIHVGALLPSAAPLADLDLAVGALAASTHLNACPYAAVDARDYGVASLELVQHGDAISGFTPRVLDAVGLIETTVEGLAADMEAIIRGEILGGSIVQIRTTLDVDLRTAVAPLLTGVRSDPAGIVTVDLDAGEIRVNLANLLTGQPHGLNGRAPNTELLDAQFSAAAAPQVVSIVNGLLAGLVDDVVAVVDATLAATPMEIFVGTALANLPLFRIWGTLGDLHLSLLSSDADATILTRVLNAIVALVASTITTSVDGLALSMIGDVSAVGDGLGASLQALDALSLMVNVQPDQPGAPPGPAVAAGTVQVSALRVGVLSGIADGASLRLATATAGPNALRAA